MIIPVDDGYVRGPIRAIQLHFKVKELKQKGSSKWIWEEVTCFGDGDQVLFVSRDYCFFVDVAEFPECHLRNCIVFSDDAFPEYSESECCWNYGSKGGNEVAVFSLEVHGRFSAPVDCYFSNILWSTPIWLSQSKSLQPQAHSQSPRQSEPGITPSDFNVKHKKPFKSASEEQCVGISSSNEAQAEPAKLFPDMTDVRHIVDQDVEERDYVENFIGQTQSGFSAHLVQPFEKKVVTVKFQGMDVELEHLPVLEKVRKKYGDVVEGSAIRGCDVRTMAWSSLAKMLLILQSNSGNTLTDDEAQYLSTSLSDLK